MSSPPNTAKLFLTVYFKRKAYFKKLVLFSKGSTLAFPWTKSEPNSFSDSGHKFAIFVGFLLTFTLKSCNLLGVHINKHLKWDDQIKHTVSECYDTLSILRKLKYLAKYELSRQLAETLILSKLDYADLFFYPLPQCLLRHLQRVQFAAARFVFGHYVKNFQDVLKIGWLPINERKDLNLLKSCFKALHNTETWPDYLKIIKQECHKELRPDNSIRLGVPTENGTFQDCRSYLTIYQKLLETVKITEPF